MKIGVIGGGQLAQMLTLAGYPLGLKVICLEPAQTCPAGLVTDVIPGDYDDSEKLALLAKSTDVVTYEFENISAQALATLNDLTVYPPPSALAISQDRLQEKLFFERLQIPTTQYLAVASLEDLRHATERVGVPAILKTRRLGYDGKGQYVIKNVKDIETAWQALQNQSLLLENKIAFEREVSCIGVRNKKGETVFYPLVENQHRDGILRVSQIAEASTRIEKLAQEYVQRILSELNYVGVLTVEFFQKDGQLLANEIAPRVHNSGHWTIEGADTSQFENHLRAICDLPLGSTKARGHVAMVNIIGHVPDTADLLRIPHTHLHLYGKQARAGRKLGHVTLCVDNEKTFKETLKRLLAVVRSSEQSITANSHEPTPL